MVSVTNLPLPSQSYRKKRSIPAIISRQTRAYNGSSQNWSMYCAISGVAPEHPVVSRKSGHVFERRLILKALTASGGKCPVTGDDLSEDDLIGVQVSGAFVQPIPSSAASLPGLLKHMQDEWDAVALETYRLKQTLATTRQELAHALYQYDAATRVIARLTREREDAILALENRTQVIAPTQPNSNATDSLMPAPQEPSESLVNENEIAPMDSVENAEDEIPQINDVDDRSRDKPDLQQQSAKSVPAQESPEILKDDPISGKEQVCQKLSQYILDDISSSYQTLTNARKARKVSATLATTEDIRHYDATHSLFVSGRSDDDGSGENVRSAVSALEILSLRSEESVSDSFAVAVGCGDGNITLCSCKDLSLVGNGIQKAHDGAITCLTQMKYHDELFLLSGGCDGSIRAWPSKQLTVATGLSSHSSPGYITARRPRAKNRSPRSLEAELAGGFTLDENRDVAITDLSMHPAGRLLLSADTRGWWRMYDVEKETQLTCASVKSDQASCIHSCQVHPDGMIFGVGKSSGEVEMWDMKDMSRVASLGLGTVAQGEAQVISMSENGYFMVVAGGGTLRVWDLRKLKVRREESYSIGQGILNDQYNGVALDWSGVFCAATTGTAGVRILETRSAKHVADLELQTKPMSKDLGLSSGVPRRLGMKWMDDARGLFAGTVDGTLIRFSARADDKK